MILFSLFMLILNVIHGFPIRDEHVLYEMATSLNENGSTIFETSTENESNLSTTSVTLGKHVNKSEEDYNLTSITSYSEHQTTISPLNVTLTEDLTEESEEDFVIKDTLWNVTLDGYLNHTVLDNVSTITIVPDENFTSDQVQNTEDELLKSENFTTNEEELNLPVNSFKDENETKLILENIESLKFTTLSTNPVPNTSNEDKSNSEYYNLNDSVQFVLKQSYLTTERTELTTKNLNFAKTSFINCTKNRAYKAVTNEFEAHFISHETVVDVELFQHYLERYFPNNGCNLAVTAISIDVVKWTDYSMNKSGLCSSKAYQPKILQSITNDPKFRDNFLPEFDIQSVNWTSHVNCVIKRRDRSTIVGLDIVIYVFGSLLLLGVVSVIVIFFRAKMHKNQPIDTNSTPNSYQKYTLRGRKPVFLSPEVERSTIVATCNPAFIDDETVEPKAKHFVEN